MRPTWQTRRTSRATARHDVNGGGPHTFRNHVHDFDHGRMDGFLRQGDARRTSTATTRTTRRAATAPGSTYSGTTRRATSRTTGRYAHRYVLQDHMFEPVAVLEPARAPVAGLGVVGALHDPRRGVLHQRLPGGSASARRTGGPARAERMAPKDPVYAWTDLTYLLHRQHVSWGYYVQPGYGAGLPAGRGADLRLGRASGAERPGCGTRCRDFVTVQQDHQLRNISSTADFVHRARTGHAADGELGRSRPTRDSEHPPARVSAGQSYVTRLVDSVMHGKDWRSTAIFLAWDDWGGFYDHVAAAARRLQRLRHAGAGAGDQPVRQDRVRRPPVPVVRRVREVHRGRLPGRPAARPAHRRPPASGWSSLSRRVGPQGSAGRSL